MKKTYALWMLLAGKPGSLRNAALLRAMTPEQVYHATKETLTRYISEKDAEFFENKDLTPAIKAVELCKEKKIRIVCYHDAVYPPKLREIEDPPSVLFSKGVFPEGDAPTVGIVGTRNCSLTAAGVAASFACSLAASGFRIVSGMANGVDTYAHKGTMLKGFPSFAVLGCGVDVIYPRQNGTLYSVLLEQGGLLSEYPPGTPPLSHHFPRRNRIISGLSDGVLVVECPPKSGSMSTARHAVEQNRTLFAIPSAPGDRVNTGTNQLIKQGAVFCSDPRDVINEFLAAYPGKITPKVRYLVSESISQEGQKQPPAQPKQQQQKPKKAPPQKPAEPAPVPEQKPLRRDLSPDETKICLALTDEALSADEIAEKTGIPYFRILPLLQGLELIGSIEPLPGSLFRRK